MNDRQRLQRRFAEWQRAAVLAGENVERKREDGIRRARAQHDRARMGIRTTRRSFLDKILGRNSVD